MLVAAMGGKPILAAVAYWVRMIVVKLAYRGRT